MDGVADQLAADGQIQQAAQANDKDNFAYIFNPKLDDALVDRHGKHGDFIDKVFADPEIGRLFRTLMLDRVYSSLAQARKAEQK